ncbi:unnamed protein product [Tuber aestivum]|uniref:PAS domain-containing protein n=1 Tax=Tuber aestivum TaxID=59557 RepID=A0A292Q7G4_9PEZI|nr:unnamed protein product [Tuber aestivum]
MQAPMQPSSPRRPQVYPSFGERRSISHDLARFSLDLGPARPGVSLAAHTVPYPSPPMSHSPPPLHPLSPKQDARRRPSTSISIPQDVRGLPGRALEQHSYSHHDPQYPHQLQQQQHQGPVSATSSSADSEHFPAPFPSMNNHESPHTHSSQLPATSPGRRTPFVSPPSFPPPQLPRRTKSHVASACVNCKKAHLACDGANSTKGSDTSVTKHEGLAPETGSRDFDDHALGVSVSDTCKDVQHKKRGRPRLRDERTHSFEVGQIGALQSHRPENVSPLSSPTTRSFRTGPHRVLKSQPTDSHRYNRRPSLTPREETLGQSGSYFDDRPLPRSRGLNLPSPVPNATAYLTTELVVAKSSENVRELLGYSEHELNRVRSLYDIVVPSDRDKLYRLSRRIQDEVTEREPNYRPPVSPDSLYSAIQNVNQADIPSATHGSKDIQESLHLRRPDGHFLRTRIQINLAKTSVFFVVVVFSLVTGIPAPLQFNSSQSSLGSQSRMYTPGPQIPPPPLTSPSFLTPSQQRQLQGEPQGPQSPYSLHPSIALSSPMDSRPRTLQSESTFPSLAQYASAPSPASAGFPSVRRPVSPVASAPSSIYKSTALKNDLQLPPLQLKGITESSGGDGKTKNPSSASSDGTQASSTPRRERIGVQEMLE